MEGVTDTELLKKHPCSYSVHTQHFPSRGIQLPTLFLDGPKDSISKWLIMQTPAGLDAHDLALAGWLLDPPELVCKAFTLLGVQSWGCPESGCT